MSRLAERLPDFPWDSLDAARARAAAHPDGIVDLSVGTPVDPTPEFAQRVLAEAADAPGYPTTWGTPALRLAIIDYLAGRWSARGLVDDGVLPVVGTKELVALLPTLLGVGAELAAPENRNGDRVIVAGRDSLQDSVNQVGQEMTRRNLNIQPTLTERPGLPVRIIVNRDLVLRPYQPLFFNRGTSR